ncbi:Uncharacterised protein (plasmid) [Tsukamurella tyrosinosolvens]|nr:Uncharacterised protein [Tsukamurella tyrosinosolvens]
MPDSNIYCPHGGPGECADAYCLSCTEAWPCAARVLADELAGLRTGYLPALVGAGGALRRIGSPVDDVQIATFLTRKYALRWPEREFVVAVAREYPLQACAAEVPA